MYVSGSDLKRRSDEKLVVDLRDVLLMCETNDGTPFVMETRPNVLHSKIIARYTGFNIPHFHTRVKDGELLPFTPFDQFTFSGGWLGSKYDYRTYDGYTAQHYYCALNEANFDTSWLITEDEMREIAYDCMSNSYVQTAAARIYTKGFDALTWLAELKDVKRLWESVATKLAYIKLPKGQAAKKLAKRTLKKDLKNVSSEWLSYRYGWRQLIKDITGLYTAIRALNQVRHRYSERAGATQTSEVVETKDTEWLYVTLADTVTTGITTSVRGHVAADIEIPEFQFDVLQTGWEIIPFSFVVDWFVNVGKTLSAISLTVQASKYAASKGVRIDIVRLFDRVIKTTKQYYVSGDIYQHAKAQATLEIRTPCRVQKFPHLTLNIDGLKVLDLVGLIVQRFK